MKIGWGTGIVISFILFIGFILFFVISMSVDKKYHHDLVTEKYYQKELGFQKEINALKNATLLKEKITIQRTNTGLKIAFPSYFSPEEMQGKVFLYRPSAKQLDFEIPISISKSYLLVPDNRLVGGRWNIDISWKYKNTEYLIKEKITY